MDFTKTVILQIIVFYCLVIAFRKSPTLRSVRWSAIGIILIIGLCFYFKIKYILVVGLGLWLVLILWPLLLIRRLNSLLMQSQFDRARWLALGMRWLMPTDGMWVYPQILRGLALQQRGDAPAAEEIFSRYRSDLRLMPRMAIALSYRVANRWSELIVWVEKQQNLIKIEQDRSPVRTYYLRALGETGDLPRLLALIDRLPHSSDLLITRLQALAFSGRPEAVAKIAPVVLGPRTVSEFWLGTAELAADRGSGRLSYLQDLWQSQGDQPTSELTAQDGYIKQDVNWRLTNSLPNLQNLAAADLALIDTLETAALQEIEHSQLIASSKAMPVTKILVWLNIGVYAAEKIFSSTAQLPWIASGGLIAPLVMAGEWWRLASANFLHLNLIHLLMNMLGLNYLGKFVEQRLGSLKFMLAYILTGIGSMACVTYVDWQSAANMRVTAGASGAIMGLLGVMGAIHLVSWWRKQTARASRELKSIGFAVGLQLIFDITNGQTSIVGHFSGLAIGLMIGIVLASKIK